MSYGIKEAIILESFFLFVSADALKFLLYKKNEDSKEIEIFVSIS